MNVLHDVREIGFLEMGKNLSCVAQSGEIKRGIEAVMPLPREDILEKISEIVSWIEKFKKSQYLFLTPEIALVEEMGKRKNHESDLAYIMLPSDLPKEAKERIKQNIPKNMSGSFIEEPFFPTNFRPANGMIITCGYCAGERLYILPETYRILENYGNGFFGKKIFIPYAEDWNSVRRKEWIEVTRTKFNQIWRDTYE